MRLSGNYKSPLIGKKLCTQLLKLVENSTG